MYTNQFALLNNKDFNNKISIIGYYILYAIISIITSVPFFIKYTHKYSFYLIFLYGCIFIFLFFLIKNELSFKKIFLDWSLLWVLMIFFLGALNIYLYPSTRLVQAVSSAPSALIEPAVALFYNGLNPYSVKLFDGAPISPGFGWIFLNSSLLLSGLITILTPMYLIFSGVMVSKTSRAKCAFFYVSLVLLPINFLLMSIIGHDLPAIILALVGLALALNIYYKNDIRFIFIAVLVGLVATARVPFIIFPVALSVCLAKIDLLRARIFLVISIGIALIIHLIFWIWSYNQGIYYQPLHVFGRAIHSGSLITLFLGALAWFFSGWYGWRLLTKFPSTWMFFLWSVLSIPFIFVGINELLRDGILYSRSWENWEGKGYVMFTLPLLAAGLALDKVNELKKIKVSNSI